MTHIVFIYNLFNAICFIQLLCVGSHRAEKKEKKGKKKFKKLNCDIIVFETELLHTPHRGPLKCIALLTLVVVIWGDLIRQKHCVSSIRPKK